MSNPWTQIKLFRTGYWYVAETVFLPLTRPRGNRRAPPPSNLSVCSIWPAPPLGSTVRRTELEERLTPGTTRAMGLTPCIPDKKILYLNACQIFLGIKKLGQIHCKLFGKWGWNLTFYIFILKIDSSKQHLKILVWFIEILRDGKKNLVFCCAAKLSSM